MPPVAVASSVGRRVGFAGQCIALAVVGRPLAAVAERERDVGLARRLRVTLNRAVPVPG